MIGTRPRVTRLVVAALLVLPALVASVSPSLAAPSKADVEAAKQKLLQAQNEFAALNEQYNQQYGPGYYVPNVFIQYWSMRAMAYLALVGRRELSRSRIEVEA